MISKNNGVVLNEIEQIYQSIEDILTTPIGTRLMRREYGSLLADLIDQPTNDVVLLQMYSAIYTALFIWEDRVSIERVQISHVSKGSMTVDLEAVLNKTQQKTNLHIPIKLGAMT